MNKRFIVYLLPLAVSLIWIHNALSEDGGPLSQLEFDRIEAQKDSVVSKPATEVNNNSKQQEYLNAKKPLQVDSGPIVIMNNSQLNEQFSSEPAEEETISVINTAEQIQQLQHNTVTQEDDAPER